VAFCLNQGGFDLSAHAVIKRGVNRFSAILYKLFEIVAVLILAVTVVIVTAEVLMRLILSHGFPWTTEVGTLGLQYIAFTSMVLGVKYRLHISLLLFYDSLPKKAQKVLDKFADVCTLIFGSAFFYYGCVLTAQMWRFTHPATRWPQGTTYIICIFTGAVVVYESIVSFFGLNEENEQWTSADSDKKEGDTVV
jgi:TRAP-type C4-dicarboxylate transport system permease small subunit